MKNPQTTLDELTSGLTTLHFSAVATLEFCYNHLEDELSVASHESTLLFQEDIHESEIHQN